MQQDGNNGELLVGNMPKIFLNLNGWQRLFIVITIFIQLPITILFSHQQLIASPTAKVLEAKFKAIAESEKITQSVVINDEVTFTAPVKNESTELIELLRESERRGLGKFVAFNATNNYSSRYYVYLDNRLNEQQQLKIGNLLQNLIDKEFRDERLKYYAISFAYSILISILIYVLGMAIGWVIKGFRKV
jgi:hypothetical protein